MTNTRFRNSMLSMTETVARVVHKYLDRNIIILDVDKEVIIKFVSPNHHNAIHLVYNPPCCKFPWGHYDIYIDGQVLQITRKRIRDEYEDEDEEEDDDLLYSALATAINWRSFIPVKNTIVNPTEYPRRFGEFLAGEHFACQLKHGRALLRLNMNNLTTQIGQSEHVQLDSSHLLSCIEQALKSKKVSKLARILAKYETKSRSVEERSSGRDTEVMTSQVSRDACKLFLFSGRSVEAEVYRQLVVGRINDGDVTTALQLCCIGHQMVFGQNILDAISSTSNPQTLEGTFERMNKWALYTREKTKFLSVCDEWYRVLEPHGLMDVEQRELLGRWITERQYANNEDLVVSHMIEKCSIPIVEEKTRRKAEAKKRKDDTRKQNEEKRRRERELQELQTEEESTKREGDKATCCNIS